MRRPLLPVLGCVLTLGALACQRAAGRGAPDGGEAGPAWPADFAPYPGVRRLCSRLAPAGALRVRWTSYASADAAAAVAGFYARAHGGDPAARPFVVRGRGLTTLAVHDAAAGDVPRCPQGLAPGERSVILVTTAASRLAAAKEPP